MSIRFENLPTKEVFDNTAKRLGWQKSEELAEKILLNFLSSVNRREYSRGKGGATVN